MKTLTEADRVEADDRAAQMQRAQAVLENLGLDRALEAHRLELIYQRSRTDSNAGTLQAIADRHNEMLIGLRSRRPASVVRYDALRLAAAALRFYLEGDAEHRLPPSPTPEAHG